MQNDIDKRITMLYNVVDKFLSQKGYIKMANRIILNETSYFGAGARENIASEAKARGFKKALFVTDKDT